MKDIRRFQTANQTRWHSQLKMIKSALAVPEDKLRFRDPQCFIYTLWQRHAD